MVLAELSAVPCVCVWKEENCHGLALLFSLILCSSFYFSVGALREGSVPGAVPLNAARTLHRSVLIAELYDPFTACANWCAASIVPSAILDLSQSLWCETEVPQRHNLARRQGSCLMLSDLYFCCVVVHFCPFFLIFCISFAGSVLLTAAESLLIYLSACGRENNPFFFSCISLPVMEVIITVFAVLWNPLEAIRIEAQWGQPTIICREMHRKSCRKGFVFWQRPLR